MTQSGFNVGQLSGENFSHAEGSIGSLHFSSIAGSRNSDSYQASVGTVSANDANLTDVLGAIDFRYKCICASHIGRQTTYKANLEEITASGLKGDTFGASVNSATFSGAQLAGAGTDEMRANLADGQVNNFSMQGAPSKPQRLRMVLQVWSVIMGMFD